MTNHFQMSLKNQVDAKARNQTFIVLLTNLVKNVKVGKTWRTLAQIKI